MGPYQGTETGIVVKPKDARSKRAQPCEDMPFLGSRQKELCNQVRLFALNKLLDILFPFLRQFYAIDITNFVCVEISLEEQILNSLLSKLQ